MIKKNFFLLNTSKEIRLKILEISNLAKSSHIGSSLSIVEILLVLYKFFIKKKNVFILSKGHACLAYYCILSKFGYISSHISAFILNSG
jgi:transketolase